MWHCSGGILCQHNSLHKMPPEHENVKMIGCINSSYKVIFSQTLKSNKTLFSKDI